MAKLPSKHKQMSTNNKEISPRKPPFMVVVEDASVEHLRECKHFFLEALSNGDIPIVPGKVKVIPCGAKKTQPKAELKQQDS